MAAVSNKKENQIYSSEKILVQSTLVDSEGIPVEFASLTSVTVKAFDILGNVVEPLATEAVPTTSMKYEVDTTTLREGIVKAEVTIVYPSADFSGGVNTDIIVQELFTIAAREI